MHCYLVLLVMMDSSEDFFVQVLFEFNGSRREISLQPSTVCSVIERELRSMGHTRAIVGLINDAKEEGHFYVQRWSTRWQSFVNVESVGEICESDKLTAVPNPIKSAKVRYRNN